jgi:hypothetical protein
MGLVAPKSDVSRRRRRWPPERRLSGAGSFCLSLVISSPVFREKIWVSSVSLNVMLRKDAPAPPARAAERVGHEDGERAVDLAEDLLLLHEDGSR